MFIPLEGENIICLANVIAMYKTDEGTAILKRDGSVIRTGFTLPHSKRQLDLKGKGDLRKEFIQ